jgi:hypothetical protein
MGIVTMTSREFNQATHAPKKAAWDGPVFITDRGSLRTCCSVSRNTAS